MSDNGADIDEAERRRLSIPTRLLRGAVGLGRGLADIIMPPVCLSCRTPTATHHSLCVSCWNRISFIRPPVCDRLGLPMPFDTGGVMISAAAAADPPDFDRARAAAYYEGVVRDLVRDLKFHDRHEVRRLLAGWVCSAGSELLAGAELVVPVPLSRWRLLWRRFNQAALIAQEVAAAASLSYAPHVLVRSRATRSQVGLSRAERRRNVAGSFAVPAAARPDLLDRRIVLIDDIITTGATAGAAARALKKAGAARVDVLAVAMVTDQALVPA
jgi:ComF family protein